MGAIPARAGRSVMTGASLGLKNSTELDQAPTAPGNPGNARRRMVHEQEDRPVARLFQSLAQPAQAHLAKPAVDVAAVQRVEQDQAGLRRDIERAVD
ncbi:hypothetical protein NKI38_01450 [Mesorhizobium sp. M0621]|uniref:hypothetical protein n=1 Tax=Mesorhizobium sp. M0621 TaxID=2956974 RepID=UPI003335E976